MAKAPAFFVSHGSPTLPFENVAARDFLRGLASRFEKPKAILIASAHWETDEPLASTAKQPETIHDFYGFPPELYKLAYPAPGAPEIAARAAEALRAAGFAAAGTDPGRGLDHGAWVPLSMIYDDADVPMFQLSIQPDRDPAHHHKIGQALAKLRDDGIAIVGSGSATHN
ncbi:MAG: dioxygenase, partial [Alphaproteobacteria bacterium]|nr:dioxygenase [Alphaproteobacteria bacterium]